jgi:hypothetical protein
MKDKKNKNHIMPFSPFLFSLNNGPDPDLGGKPTSPAPAPRLKTGTDSQKE